MNIKNILYFAIGPIGIAFFGFISIPIMAWIFQPEDIGRLTMLQVSSTFAVLILTLGLDQAYIREYETSENRNSLLKHCIIPGFIFLALISATLLAFPQKTSEWIFGIQQGNLALLLVIYIALSFFSRFLSLILRMQEKGLAFSISQLAPKVTFLFLILGFYFLKDHLTFYDLLLTQLISILTVFLFFAWNTRNTWTRSINENINKKALQPLMLYGYPLALGGIAYWGLTSIDKIMLKTYSSYEQLGLYSVCISFAGAALVIQSIFSTIWAPTVFKWINKEDGVKNINLVRSHLAQIILIIFLLCCSFSWILDYLLPKQYTDAKFILMACLCYPLIYTISETTVIGINITKKTHLSLFASLIAFVINIIACYILIPKFGAIGAAISTSISFLFFLFARTEFSIFAWQLFPRKQVYLSSIAMVTTSILIIIYREHIGYLFYLVSILITTIYIYLYYKNNKKFLVDMIENR
ncbi:MULTISPECIES: oligosaccharide flippase family protein [Acinetobacter]|uniref:oligosaccharide flippase family protein n=1 Tax=Acinetobacter TaxID=469 RepID=UPI00019ADF98|nr:MULTISPECIES: oligosaccharide flippase family protein [Acinetobacter]EEH69378.1 polysaccharide biosynthesis protein [Acinetobacter sp. ATCC 27244]